jgi:hypothetical protein
MCAKRVARSNAAVIDVTSGVQLPQTPMGVRGSFLLLLALGLLAHGLVLLTAHLIWDGW